LQTPHIERLRRIGVYAMAVKGGGYGFKMYGDFIGWVDGYSGECCAEAAP
jgi:hypothetical protein